MHFVLIFLILLFSSPLHSGSVEVVSAEAKRTGIGQYHIQATLRHADTGWDHYANAWRVLAPDGSILGERILYHPHVNEQPFTRALSSILIPPGTPYIEIEGQDLVHGSSPIHYKIELD
ncbi:MAG: hypothetical protein OQK68_03545 [Sedimenticola sp.]|nr:hypothetical protein [Sedimenticola sp.]